MRITIPRLFESFALGADAAKLEPLVSFINGSVEQIVKALQSRLTFRDNVYSEIRVLTFKKGKDSNAAWTADFTPAQRTVEGLLILQTEATDGNTIASWSYAFSSSGAIVVQIYPRLMTSDSTITVKCVVLFQ